MCGMIDKEKCCGCMACMNICPTRAIGVERNDKGFDQPIIEEEQCTGCGLCEKVCPVLQRSSFNDVRNAYAVKLISDEKRAHSQSGGVFVALAEYILKVNGVVYGASQNDDLKVVYKRIETGAELEKLKGSKYVQAFGGGIFGKVERDLSNRKQVLFSGTPCLIDALLKYLEIKKCNCEKLTTCDIVCHGVPAPGIYEEYIQLLKNRYRGNVKKFTFRDKKFGWRRNVSTYRVKTRNMVSSNYVNIYESQCCLREICYECPYASLNRVGDLTVGDYWGIEKIHPEWDDNTGISLLLINTEKGQNIFEKVKKDCFFIETKVEDCLQPNLQKATERPKEYNDFWQCYRTEGFESAIKKYCKYNPNEDWEKLEKRQYFRRACSKVERICKKGRL